MDYHDSEIFIFPEHAKIIKSLDKEILKKISKILASRKISSDAPRHIKIFLDECEKDNDLKDFLKLDFYTKIKHKDVQSRRSLGGEIIMFKFPNSKLERGRYEDLKESEVFNNFEYFKRKNKRKRFNGSFDFDFDFSKGAFFLILCLPVLLFLALLPLDISWTTEECYKTTAEWFDKEDIKLLDMYGQADPNCYEKSTGFMYPKAFKFSFSFIFFICIISGLGSILDAKELSTANKTFSIIFGFPLISHIVGLVFYFLVSILFYHIFQIPPERY